MGLGLECVLNHTSALCSVVKYVLVWSVLNHTASALCSVVKYVLVWSVLNHTASALCLVVKYVLVWSVLNRTASALCLVWSVLNHTASALAVTFQWSSGRIMKMGWSIMEDLLFVQEDGVVLVYDMFLAFKRTFSMGQVGGETVTDVLFLLTE